MFSIDKTNLQIVRMVNFNEVLFLLTIPKKYEEPLIPSFLPLSKVWGPWVPLPSSREWVRAQRDHIQKTFNKYQITLAHTKYCLPCTGHHVLLKGTFLKGEEQHFIYTLTMG